MPIFTRSLPAQYRLLGDAASYVPAGGGTAVPLRVIFDAGGGLGGLDGMMQADGPQIRLQAADVPAAPAKGATFTLTASGAEWRAREKALPVLEGAEWLVPVAAG